MSISPNFFDPLDLTGCFPAGILLADLNAEVGAHELYFPFVVEDSRSILDHVNGGPYTSASHRFGALTDNILGLNLTLPSGVQLRLGGRTIKNCTGFDITHFLLNSRRSFGEITDVTLRFRTLAGPLHWLALHGTPEQIEQYRRGLSQSPWWHVLEAVDVVVEPGRTTLWIGLRGKTETIDQYTTCLAEIGPVTRTTEQPPSSRLAADAIVKTLPSRAVAQARSLVEQFGGAAHVHLTCGFFRWVSPDSQGAASELAKLRTLCVQDGGHLRSPHLTPEAPADEAAWIARLEQEWDKIKS